MKLDTRLCDHCHAMVRPDDAFSYIPLDPDRGQGDRYDFCTMEHLLAWLDDHHVPGWVA